MQMSGCNFKRGIGKTKQADCTSEPISSGEMRKIRNSVSKEEVDRETNKAADGRGGREKRLDRKVVEVKHEADKAEKMMDEFDDTRGEGWDGSLQNTKGKLLSNRNPGSNKKNLCFGDDANICRKQGCV